MSVLAELRFPGRNEYRICAYLSEKVGKSGLFLVFDSKSKVGREGHEEEFAIFVFCFPNVPRRGAGWELGPQNAGRNIAGVLILKKLNFPDRR